MNEQQRLFLVQAKSAFAVYKLLSVENTLHHCHALHYLQMSTELLGKAGAWKNGPTDLSHKALVAFLRRLAANKKAQKQLGYDGQNENWAHTLRKIIPIAESLQKLAPTLAENGPNPEYPWPKYPEVPVTAPVEYNFPIWEELTETSYGRALLSLLDKLFAIAEEYM